MFFKKILAAGAAFTIGTSFVSTVVACGPTNNEIEVLVVPSRDIEPTSLNKLSNIVHDKLLDKGYDKKINFKIAPNYDQAAGSVMSGNTALAFLPIVGYYENSIANNSNVMHQLAYSTRPTMTAEYNTADGEIDSPEKLEQMNKNGTSTNMELDQTNIFKLVMESSDYSDSKQIFIPANKHYEADYYRGYQYINKKILKKYHDEAISDLTISDQLKKAWEELVVIEDNGENNHAVFEKTAEATPQNLLSYWQVIWDIYVRASEDKGIAFSNNAVSEAGRISPIWTMMEAYLLSNNKDLDNQNNIKEAQDKVYSLLNEKFVALSNYNTTALTYLMSDRISIANTFAGSRGVYIASDYTQKQLMDDLTIFTASYGINNDGIVYSTRYFKNNFELLKSLQEIFIELLDKNEEVQNIIFNITGYTSLKPIAVDDDGSAIKKYEETLKKVQTNPLKIISTKIANSIRAKGGSN